MIWLIAPADWHTSSNRERGNEGKQILRKHEPRVSIHFAGLCLPHSGFAVAPSQHSFICLSPSLFRLVPLCLFPSFSVSCYFLSHLILSGRFLLCSYLVLKKKNTPPPSGRGCLLSIPLFFILSSTVPGETTDTERQYLDSSSGRQGSSMASLHELASEAVMSKPETSQGPNRARWLPPCPVMTDREIVLSLWEAATIFDVCSRANGLGNESQDGRLP